MAEDTSTAGSDGKGSEDADIEATKGGLLACDASRALDGRNLQSGVDERAVQIGVDAELAGEEVVIIEDGVLNLLGDLKKRVAVDFFLKLAHHVTKVTDTGIDSAVDTVANTHKAALLGLDILNVLLDTTVSLADLGKALVGKVDGTSVERTSAGGNTTGHGRKRVRERRGRVEEGSGRVGHLVIGEEDPKLVDGLAELLVDVSKAVSLAHHDEHVVDRGESGVDMGDERLPLLVASSHGGDDHQSAERAVDTIVGSLWLANVDAVTSVHRDLGRVGSSPGGETSRDGEESGGIGGEGTNSAHDRWVGNHFTGHVCAELTLLLRGREAAEDEEVSDFLVVVVLEAVADGKTAVGESTFVAVNVGHVGFDDGSVLVTLVEDSQTGRHVLDDRGGHGERGDLAELRSVDGIVFDLEGVGAEGSQIPNPECVPFGGWNGADGLEEVEQEAGHQLGKGVEVEDDLVSRIAVDPDLSTVGAGALGGWCESN
jgi:hypothetical protein